MKSKYPLLKVTVDRRRWLRGEGSIASSLFNDYNKKMCCLGFATRACGCSIDKIRGRASPALVVMGNTNTRESLARFLDAKSEVTDSGATLRMMDINDDTDINDAEREDRLKRWGKKLNIQFTFVN